MVSHLLRCQLQRGYLSSYRFMLPFRDIYITLSSLGVPALVRGAQACREPSFHHRRRRVKLQWLLLLERAHVVRTKTKWDPLGWDSLHWSGPSVIYLWYFVSFFIFSKFKTKDLHLSNIFSKHIISFLKTNWQLSTLTPAIFLFLIFFNF